MPDCISEVDILELKKEEEDDRWVGRYQCQGGEGVDGKWADPYHSPL